jgi:NAD dependent epimerase/dehydratase family enzyme
MAKEMLLKGQLATPSVLQNTGFRFKSDTLDKFLKQ